MAISGKRCIIDTHDDDDDDDDDKDNNADGDTNSKSYIINRDKVVNAVFLSASLYVSKRGAY